VHHEAILAEAAVALSVMWCLELSAYFWISEINKDDWLRGMIHLRFQMPDPARSSRA